MYIEWNELIVKRDWCAAELWNKMMDNIKTSEPEEPPLIDNIDELLEEEKMLKRKEAAIKIRDKLLAKNPNHFRDLRAKRFQKLEQ